MFRAVRTARIQIAQYPERVCLLDPEVAFAVRSLPLMAPQVNLHLFSSVCLLFPSSLHFFSPFFFAATL